MGEKNDTICSYLSIPKVCADFINGNFYSGKQVIMPDELKSLGYTGKEEHSDRSGKINRKMRSRDVAKIRAKGNQYAIIAIENQDELHFFMPFRCMEYDVEDYARQLRRLKEHHQKAGDLKPGAEFLAGVKETDKLKPVIPIVFYHGKGEWNTCRELHDMLDFNGENEILKEITPNYRINVLSLQDMNEENFQTGLREVIGLMKRRDDKVQMHQFCQDNEDRFRSMDEDTFDTIRVMTEWKELRKSKEKNLSGGGKIDMCRAIDEWRKELFQDGEQAGIEKGIHSGIMLGEQKFALLVGKLLTDGRIEELQIASVNEENRKALYEEYGMDCADT